MKEGEGQSGPSPRRSPDPPWRKGSSDADETIASPRAGAARGGQESAGRGSSVQPPGGETLVFGQAEAPSGMPAIPGVTLVRELGRGGMGVVYEGRQGYLDRRVAVKLLSDQCKEVGFTARFQREAKILASLTHAHIVACYQAGVAPGGNCFLVMEYIDGPNLAQWIAEHGPLAIADALLVCRDVAQALAHAFRSTIIHRDVKPANVLLARDPGRPAGHSFPYRPKLVDLGLARPTSQDSTMMELTVQGTVMGSPPTMAPEQFDDPDKVDFRTDIYGLGCVLYHCLTGKLAFPQSSITAIIASKMQEAPPDPRELLPGLPKGVSGLVRSMLAKDREQRPRSYDELLATLDLLIASPGPRRSPARLAGLVLGGAVLVLAGFAGLRVLRQEDHVEPSGELASLGAGDESQTVREPQDPGQDEPLGQGPAGTNGSEPSGESEDPGTAGTEPRRFEPEPPEVAPTEVNEPQSRQEQTEASESEAQEAPGEPSQAGDGSQIGMLEELALDLAPELAPSVRVPLFDDLFKNPIGRWERSGSNNWQSMEDKAQSAEISLDAGETARLALKLPRGNWVFTGSLQMLGVERLQSFRLRLQFSDGSQFMLEQVRELSAGEDRQAALKDTFSLLVRQVETGVEGAAAELSPAIELQSALSLEAYKAQAGVTVRLTWRDRELTAEWAGGEIGRETPLEALDFARVAGPRPGAGTPLRLFLEVDAGPEGGTAFFSAFELALP